MIFLYNYVYLQLNKHNKEGLFELRISKNALEMKK